MDLPEYAIYIDKSCLCRHSGYGPQAASRHIVLWAVGTNFPNLTAAAGPGLRMAERDLRQAYAKKRLLAYR